jgi:hypothetical protein
VRKVHALAPNSLIGFAGPIVPALELVEYMRQRTGELMIRSRTSHLSWKHAMTALGGGLRKTEWGRWIQPGMPAEILFMVMPELGKGLALTLRITIERRGSMLLCHRRRTPPIVPTSIGSGSLKKEYLDSTRSAVEGLWRTPCRRLC